MKKTLLAGILSLTISSFGFAQDPVSVVAHYPLDTNAQDASGNGLHGQIYNATFVAGHFGKAIDLTGQKNSYIKLPSTISLAGQQSMSISAWIQLDGGHPDARIISRNAGSSSSWELLTTMVDNKRTFRFAVKAGGNEQRLIAGSVEIGTWMHVASTYDGNMLRLYNNGVQVGQISHNGTINLNSNDTIAIGHWSNDWGVFDGRIDDLAVYKGALSPNQVLTVMNTGVATLGATPDETPETPDETPETPDETPETPDETPETPGEIIVVTSINGKIGPTQWFLTLDENGKERSVPLAAIYMLVQKFSIDKNTNKEMEHCGVYYMATPNPQTPPEQAHARSFCTAFGITSRTILKKWKELGWIETAEILSP